MLLVHAMLLCENMCQIVIASMYKYPESAMRFLLYIVLLYDMGVIDFTAADL